VTFGHRRLCVIDPKGGHQPLSNENGKVWIVYNGETYNYPSLRQQLRAKGHTFTTHSDTECLVHLYEDKGADFLSDLRGQFALAIWDEEKKNLLLGRDRLGQKPLFFFKDSRRGIFAFASELKSLLEVPGFERSVDSDAIRYYLSYQYVPHPFCIFRSASKLSPAHYLLWNPLSDRAEERRYWSPDFLPDHGAKICDLRDELKETLKEAVRMRLISDVPLGAFLSGGLDSSITVALMSELCGEPVRTYSIAFDNVHFDESSYAQMVARHCGTNHRQETVSPRALEVLPDIVWHYDEPFGDSSAIPTYYVSRMARKHVKVVLTGDGGDECFAGYPRYAAAWLGERWDRMPEVMKKICAQSLWRHLPVSFRARTTLRRFRRFVLGLSVPECQRYFRWMAIFNGEEQNSLLSEDFRKRLSVSSPEGFLEDYHSEIRSADHAHNATYMDIMSYLPCDLLTKVDIASMAHGLETRSPFLDHRVVELAGRIPMRYKLRLTHRGVEGKRILKEAFGDYLPRPVLARRKMGFGVPVGDWLCGELREPLREMLLSRRGRERGYFKIDAVKNMIDEHVRRECNHTHRLWSLFMLELWHRRFVDNGELGL
jgi:asparagine synthase (glutamine-hydrolysing)